MSFQVKMLQRIHFYSMMEKVQLTSPLSLNNLSLIKCKNKVEPDKLDIVLSNAHYSTTREHSVATCERMSTLLMFSVCITCSLNTNKILLMSKIIMNHQLKSKSINSGNTLLEVYCLGLEQFNVIGRNYVRLSIIGHRVCGISC